MGALAAVAACHSSPPASAPATAAPAAAPPPPVSSTAEPAAPDWDEMIDHEPARPAEPAPEAEIEPTLDARSMRRPPEVPHLATPCDIAQVIDAMTRGKGERCGDLGMPAPHMFRRLPLARIQDVPAFAAGRDCMLRALRARSPFSVSWPQRGIDSVVRTGWVAIDDAGRYRVYQLHYDSDPCGGGCPERGHTSIHRCRRLLPIPKCENVVEALCFHCEPMDSFEACRRLRGEGAPATRRTSGRSRGLARPPRVVRGANETGRHHRQAFRASSFLENPSFSLSDSCLFPLNLMMWM